MLAGVNPKRKGSSGVAPNRKEHAVPEAPATLKLMRISKSRKGLAAEQLPALTDTIRRYD